MKIILFYWLKNRADLLKFKDTLKTMSSAEKVLECIVGEPKQMNDDIMDMSYDLAMELTLASDNDFDIVFHTPEHMAIGEMAACVVKRVQGYNIIW